MTTLREALECVPVGPVTASWLHTPNLGGSTTMARPTLRSTRAALTVAAIIVMASAGCGLNSNSSSPGTGQSGHASDVPLTFGASLPLTGPFAEFGKAARGGYETWAAEVNSHGGILGRQVKLVTKDDASDQNTAVADYNALLYSDHVDFVLGTYSSLLVGPTSAIAEKAGKVFITPTGGAPALFQRGFKMLFLTQQATAIGIGNVFAKYILGLPAADRPKAAAYPVLNDPFQIPTIDNVRKQLEATGIKTVYRTVYASDTQNFDSIASQIKSTGADLMVQGAGFDDAVGMTRSLIKLGASPRILYQASGPDTGTAYGNAVGTANTNGVFFSTTWSELASTPGNTEFLARFHKLFPGETPKEDAADAYVAGQVLQTAIAAVGASGVTDQSKIADWLRKNKVTTIIGPLEWNADGSPKGDELLGQWQNNVIQIVKPDIAATTKTIIGTWRSSR